MTDASKTENRRGHAQLLGGVTIVRSIVGGVLMGLANLVPGISGGTMLLASGIYTRFIDAIADVTTLRWRTSSLAVLGTVVVSAAGIILVLAGGVKALVVAHRWAMYSIFIGLTLGGIPVIWTMIREATRSVWAGGACGFVAMILLALVQQMEWGTAASPAAGLAMLFLAGVAGASAMILPGVSGGYLLLVLGQYVPILRAIDEFKHALSEGALEAAVRIGLGVGIPVGLGVVVGVVGVSNLVRVCLHRFEKATLGVLLGLLVGAVVGLWPFQAGFKPAAGDVVKGREMTPALIEALDPEDYPTRFFTPGAGQVGASLGLVLLGFGITLAVSRLGREDPAA